MLQCFQNLIDLTKHIESENLFDTIFNSHFDYVIQKAFEAFSRLEMIIK